MSPTSWVWSKRPFAALSVTVTAQDKIAEQMAQLRRRFRDRCPERSAALLKACEEGNDAAIRSLAHDITGSAGLFGYPALSEEAQALTDCCRNGRPEEAYAAARALSASLMGVAAEND